MHPDAAIEIRVGSLLERKLDVAANGATSDFFCAAVCRFHDAGTATSHDCEPESRDGRAHFSSQLVMPIVGFDAGRADNSCACSYEMECSKAEQKIRAARGR